MKLKCPKCDAKKSQIYTYISGKRRCKQCGYTGEGKEFES